MLNWPGRKESATAGSFGVRTIVMVSAVSDFRSRTANGTGVQGLAGGSARGGYIAISDPVKVEQLELGILEPLGDHREDPQQEGVAVHGVLIEQGAEMRGRAPQGAGRLERARVQPPTMRGGQPGPTDDLARSQRLDRRPRPPGKDDLKRDLTGENEEEFVRGVSFSDQKVPRLEAALIGDGAQVGEEGRVHA